MRLDDGEALVIGRSAEADWRIDDPDQYVSRAHCTVSGRCGAFTVTDTSSGGLFVDDARSPLGAGRPLPPCATACGCASATTSSRRSSPPRRRPSPPAGGRKVGPNVSPRQPRGRARFDADGFFATPAGSRPAPTPPRPARPLRAAAELRRRCPARATRAAGLRRPLHPRSADTSRLRERPATASFDWGAPAPPATPRPAAGGRLRLGRAGARARAPGTACGAAAGGSRAARRARRRPAVAAFLRGLGLDPADAPGRRGGADGGLRREYRMMAEGLMQLLRLRAEEKGNARIAQTVVGARVNPLKFMPTVDDALAVLIAPPSGGFTDAETSIGGAVRDLAAHHIDTWRGIQAALRPDDRPLRPRRAREGARGRSACSRSSSPAAGAPSCGSSTRGGSAKSPRAPRRASWARSGRISATPTKPRRSEPCLTPCWTVARFSPPPPPPGCSRPAAAPPEARRRHRGGHRRRRHEPAARTAPTGR